MQIWLSAAIDGNALPSCSTIILPVQILWRMRLRILKTSAITPQPIETPSKPTITDHERKHVTVLFSDLSGYTAMTEKLDPEEVKEIMDRIFGKISQVVVKYEGFIEKFVGDAVMAIFGVPNTHEDDPVRAIRAHGRSMTW